MRTLRQSPPESLLDAPSKSRVCSTNRVSKRRHNPIGDGQNSDTTSGPQQNTSLTNENTPTQRSNEDVGDEPHDDDGVRDGGISLDGEFCEISTLPLDTNFFGMSFNGPQELLELARRGNHAKVAILPSTMAKTSDKLSASGKNGGKPKIALDHPPFSDVAGFGNSKDAPTTRLPVKRKAAACTAHPSKRQR